MGVKTKAKEKVKKVAKRAAGPAAEKVREKRQEVVAIGLIGLSLFCLVAVLSFRENYSIPQQPGEGWVNLCGLFGYWIADRFLWLFGSASSVLFLFLGMWGGVLFVRRGVIGITPKIFGILVFTICLSVFFHLHAPYDGTPVDAVKNGRRPYGLGGMIGHWIEPGVSSAFGPFGTYVFIFIMMAISFLLATEWCFYPLLASMIRKWQERKERLAEMELVEAEEKQDKDEKEELTEAPKGWRRFLPSWLGGKTKTVEEPTKVLQPAAAAAVEIKKPAEKAEKPEKPVEPKPSLVSKLLNKTPKSEVPAKLEAPDPPKEKRIPIPRPAKAANYKLPPIDLLDEPEKISGASLEKEIKANAAVLEAALKSFGVDAKVVAVEKGPAVTMYELELAAGTKVSRIIALADDLAIALKASSVRVVAPIPGKSTVGIEVPNSIRERVRMKELIASPLYKRDVDAIPLFLGKDVGGKPLVDDLAQMPHLLIAGATGSGKSVMVNSIISSVLMTRTPEEVKLILIDPKMVELQAFQSIPHLLCPVVTNPRKASTILEWACLKMDARYELLSRVGVKSINSYNQIGEEEIRKKLGASFVEGETETHLPYLVVIIDELADLMLLAAKEVEISITRLAQKSRAVGIHVILATQRPSTDVITGLIKANLPTRIAFQVASKIDSRVILDANGADKLLGAGDMLYTPPKSSALVRSQATYLADPEIKRIVTHWSQIAAPQFSQELIQTSGGASKGDDVDELYEQAVRVVLEQQRGSASLLQRAFGIGYTRASRLIDVMREQGIVGEYKGSKSSEVMMTLKDWEAQQGSKGPAKPEQPTPS